MKQFIFKQHTTNKTKTNHSNNYTIYLTTSLTPIGFISMKTYNSILLINHIQLTEEYQHQSYGTQIIQQLLQNHSYIFGESTKRATSFWQKQINLYSGTWFHQTLCHNTSGSFLLPERNCSTSYVQQLLKETYSL